MAPNEGDFDVLASSSAAKERILSIGTWGSGKTTGWVSIARWYRNTNTPGMFYVLDTDNTSLRSLEQDDDWEKNVVRVDINEWSDLTKQTTDWFNNATGDDWLIVDSIDKPWTMVQDHYVEEMFGKEADIFFMDQRKANQAGHPLASDYGSNWTVINKLYSKWMGQVIRWPGHVYACSPSQPVSEPNAQGKGGDSREIRETFGRYGVRPAGQKNLAFQVHTVLLMQSPAKDEWSITSVKDRSRELLLRAPVIDFTMSYLLAVAGWQVTD